jgi:hypothetical protein
MVSHVAGGGASCCIAIIVRLSLCKFIALLVLVVALLLLFDYHFAGSLHC